MPAPQPLKFPLWGHWLLHHTSPPVHSGVFWEYPDVPQRLSPVNPRDGGPQWDPEGLNAALDPAMISLVTQVIVT